MNIIMVKGKGCRKVIATDVSDIVEARLIFDIYDIKQDVANNKIYLTIDPEISMELTTSTYPATIEIKTASGETSTLSITLNNHF